MATENKSTERGGKETLLPFLKALNEEDFETARSFVTDDLQFEGVLGSRAGAAAYFTDMERMRFRYALKSVIAEGEEVAALFDVTIQGKAILTAGWYHLTDGKISSIRVIFDPRPLFEKRINRSVTNISCNSMMLIASTCGIGCNLVVDLLQLINHSLVRS